jgi:hypothetical protein
VLKIYYSLFLCIFVILTGCTPSPSTEIVENHLKSRGIFKDEISGFRELGISGKAPKALFQFNVDKMSWGDSAENIPSTSDQVKNAFFELCNKELNSSLREGDQNKFNAFLTSHDPTYATIFEKDSHMLMSRLIGTKFLIISFTRADVNQKSTLAFCTLEINQDLLKPFPSFVPSKSASDPLSRVSMRTRLDTLKIVDAGIENHPLAGQVNRVDWSVALQCTAKPLKDYLDTAGQFHDCGQRNGSVHLKYNKASKTWEFL